MSRNETWTVLARVVSLLMMCAGIGALIMGLFALVVGSMTADGPPSCDGREMHPGDSCWTSFNGQTNSESYREVLEARRSGEREHRILVLGAVLVGGGAVAASGSWWVMRRTERG